MSTKYRPILIQSDGEEDAHYLVDQVKKQFESRKTRSSKEIKAFNALIDLRGELDSSEIAIECLEEAWIDSFVAALLNIGIKIFNEDEWDRLGLRMRKNRSRRIARIMDEPGRKVSIDIAADLKNKLKILISKRDELDTYDDAVKFLYKEFVHTRAKLKAEKAIEKVENYLINRSKKRDG